MAFTSDNDQMAEFKATFFDECTELLADLEQRLFELKTDADDKEDLHAIFRAVHSIKAGAGIFGFAELMNFSHHVEAMLESLRHTAELSPMVVVNGKPDAQAMPSHLAAQGFYLLRARTKLREITNILLK